MSIINPRFNLGSFINEQDKIILYINDYQIECSKTNLSNISPVVNQYFEDNPDSTEFKIILTQNEVQFDIIKSIFQNKEFRINSQNDLFINEFASILQIHTLEEMSENWEIYELLETESILFEINYDILNEFTKESITDDDNDDDNDIALIKEKLKIIGTETFCRLIINACISKPKLINVYLKLVQYLAIEKVFCRIILHEMENLDGIFSLRAEKVQIICYLVRYFYDHGLIEANKIQSLYKNLPVFFADLSDNPNLVSNELKANNWFEFKKLAAEGINPNPISKLLRNDDIDTFQQITCLPTFNFNETIKPSEFESSDFINHRPCTYLEFCAFFCSMKCFKYLYLSEETNKSDDLIKYAVAGGNAEIIHICEHIGITNFKETREIAIKYHHWEIFEWLSENKYQSDSNQEALSTDDMFSFLYQSIQFSNFTTFLYLIQKNADYNLALPFAIDNDNILLTKWLFKHKKNLFKEESSKSVIKSFLHFACRNENVDMLNLLLSEKDYCNINSKYDGKTPIIVAIEKENFELYKILIQQPKIKLDIRDFSGKQAIHFACEHENVEILEHLLKNKMNEIDVNSCDKKENTPLLLACEKGNFEIIKVLFKYCNHNVNINVTNNLYYTPFIMAWLAKKKEKRLPIIQFLYENIPDLEYKKLLINYKGPMDKTLLHFACENGECEIVRYLLSLPIINVNTVDYDKKTPLISAIIAGNNQIISLLLNHKDIDIGSAVYDIAKKYNLSPEMLEKLKNK